MGEGTHGPSRFSPHRAILNPGPVPSLLQPVLRTLLQLETLQEQQRLSEGMPPPLPQPTGLYQMLL